MGNLKRCDKFLTKNRKIQLMEKYFGRNIIHSIGLFATFVSNLALFGVFISNLLCFHSVARKSSKI